MRRYWFKGVKPDGAGVKVNRLVGLLRSEHGVDIGPGYQFRRIRAGHWQRSAGAWSWHLQWKDEQGGHREIGSQWPVSYLLRSGMVVSVNTHVQWCVDPTKFLEGK